MNLDRALERAHAMNAAPAADGTPPKGAARLYADIEFELAMGDPTPEQERSGEAALAVLEEHYPGIKNRADDIVENGHIPQLSRKANDRVFGPRKRTRGEHSDHDAGGKGGGVAAPPRPAAVPAPARQTVQRARVTRSRPRNPARAAKTVAYQLDDASGGWGSVLAMFLVGGVLLSILLLALRQTSSITKAETGVTNVISWILNPAVDPLRPPGSNTIAKSRTPSPTINAYGRPTPAGGFRP